MSLKMDNFFSYLPISENNMRWDLYLTGVGLATVPPGGVYPPKGHPGVYNFRWESGRVLPEYQILLIAGGQGTFESAKTEETIVHAGNIILLFPGIWHRYRPVRSSGWKEYWLSWNGEQLYRLMRKGILDVNRPVLSVEHPEQIRTGFERILNHVQIHPAENSNVLSAYAMEILTLAMDTVVTHQVHKDTALPMEYAHTVDDPVIFKALQIIWNHSYRDYRVDDIVELLPVSRRTLERKFLHVLNRPIRSEITRCRLERAKHLLTNTTLPIKHIAFSVGFSSTDRMGKIFQREMGMTPSQYRKNVTTCDNKGR
jgi:AraC-like DNA-binding protein